MRRSLPYAAQLTAIFKDAGVSFFGEKVINIPPCNIYCLEHVLKFMKFKRQGDTVMRDQPFVSHSFAHIPIVEPLQDSQPQEPSSPTEVP